MHGTEKKNYRKHRCLRRNANKVKNERKRNEDESEKKTAKHLSKLQIENFMEA